MLTIGVPKNVPRKKGNPQIRKPGGRSRSPGSRGFRVGVSLWLFRVLYWGYMGIMENKMETTMVYWGILGVIWG